MGWDFPQTRNEASLLCNESQRAMLRLRWWFSTVRRIGRFADSFALIHPVSRRPLVSVTPSGVEWLWLCARGAAVAVTPKTNNKSRRVPKKRNGSARLSRVTVVVVCSRPFSSFRCVRESPGLAWKMPFGFPFVVSVCRFDSNFQDSPSRESSLTRRKVLPKPPKKSSWRASFADDRRVGKHSGFASYFAVELNKTLGEDFSDRRKKEKKESRSPLKETGPNKKLFLFLHKKFCVLYRARIFPPRISFLWLGF